MSLDTTIEDEAKNQISEALPKSFACLSLTRLSGGTANFVYRGILCDTTKSIIIKHTKDHSASNPDFKIDIQRCHFEEAILRSLDCLPPYSEAGITVKTPQLLHFDAKTGVQIVEDLPNSVDLKTFLLSKVSSGISKSSARSLGRALGSWLRSFHDWGNSNNRDECKETLSRNQTMKDLKFWVNYTMLLDTVKNFPTILDKNRDIFERVHKFAATELTQKDCDDEYGIIHGDFWTGNILILNVEAGDQLGATLFVIDWELSQIGSRALDLGQMIAELYETELFNRSKVGVSIIEGLLQGYGHLSDKMAFRTAIHVGVHLVCWGSRVPGWGSEDQVEEVVKVGNDLIVHGWAKDKEWFENHALGFLFKN